MNAKSRLMRLPAAIIDRLLGTAGEQRLSILIYHRVLENEDYLRPGDPTAAQFNQQMELHKIPGTIKKVCSVYRLFLLFMQLLSQKDLEIDLSYGEDGMTIEALEIKP